MSAGDLQNLASAMADECRAVARALGATEQGVVEFARGERDHDGLLRELQTIDAAQQTLDDLAGVLAAMSSADLTRDGAVREVLATVRQTTMRAKIAQAAGWTSPAGEDGDDPAGDGLELW